MRTIHNKDGKQVFRGELPIQPNEEVDFQAEVQPETTGDELETVKAERDQYLDQLQRSLAEFANYRRRVDHERSQARKIATRDLLSDVVGIADDFNRALDAVPADNTGEPWLTGVSLIERKLTALLEREGVTPVEALGQPFDPSKHEAVAVDPGSSGSTVTEVFQNGYWHGDLLLRPAMVKVGDPVSERMAGADGHVGN